MSSNGSGLACLSKVVLQVRQALATTGQPWALFGGGAVAAFHPARVIRDIDFITFDSVLPSAAAILGTGLVRDDYHQSIIRYANVDIYGRLKIRTAQGLFIFGIDEEMSRRIQVGRVAALQLSLPILSREDNIVLKAILKRGAQHDKQDLNDIRILHEVGPLDLDYLEWRIERCAARGWADQLLQQMEILS